MPTGLRANEFRGSLVGMGLGEHYAFVGQSNLPQVKKTSAQGLVKHRHGQTCCGELGVDSTAPLCI